MEKTLFEGTIHNRNLLDQALNELEKDRFDLVLMDVQMPEMDGITATRRIRDLPGETAGSRFIALTVQRR